MVHNWKMIIYFQFSKNATLDLVKNLIRNCEAVGANVRGVIFDMGNHTFMSELKLFKKLTHTFPNPVDESRNVFVFPDAPHCLKNLRNHTNDDGMVILNDDGARVDLSLKDFESLLLADRGAFKRRPKLTPSHLYVTGSERQRVRPAVQQFSASVSKAMVSLLGSQYEEKARVISTVDNWFDVSNSRLKFDIKKPLRCGLGKFPVVLFLSVLHSDLPSLSSIVKTTSPVKTFDS